MLEFFLSPLTLAEKIKWNQITMKKCDKGGHLVAAGTVQPHLAKSHMGRDGCSLQAYMYVGASTVGGCSCATLTLPPRAPPTHAAPAPCTAGACVPRKGRDIRSALFVHTRRRARAAATQRSIPPPPRRHVKRVHGSDSVHAAAMDIRLFFPHA